jgi:hypothetical protein
VNPCQGFGRYVFAVSQMIVVCLVCFTDSLVKLRLSWWPEFHGHPVQFHEQWD